LKPNNLVYIKALFVCWKIVSFSKIIFMESKFLKSRLFFYIWQCHKKIEKYFLVFGYPIKIRWKIIFLFVFKFIKRIGTKIDIWKRWSMKLKKQIINYFK
jgi:hypothetical protein